MEAPFSKLPKPLNSTTKSLNPTGLELFFNSCVCLVSPTGSKIRGIKAYRIF